MTHIWGWSMISILANGSINYFYVACGRADGIIAIGPKFAQYKVHFLGCLFTNLLTHKSGKLVV